MVLDFLEFTVLAYWGWMMCVAGGMCWVFVGGFLCFILLKEYRGLRMRKLRYRGVRFYLGLYGSF